MLACSNGWLWSSTKQCYQKYDWWCKASRSSDRNLNRLMWSRNVFLVYVMNDSTCTVKLRNRHCTANLICLIVSMQLISGFCKGHTETRTTVIVMSCQRRGWSDNIKCILPEFVSYLGKEGCCVWETVDISVNQSLNINNNIHDYICG